MRRASLTLRVRVAAVNRLQFRGRVTQSGDMLIPRFTLRWLFAVTTVVAVIALVASWAGRGIPWAIGVTAAVLMLAVVILFHVAMFAIVWLFAEFTRRRQPPEPVAAPRGESSPP